MTSVTGSFNAGWAIVLPYLRRWGLLILAPTGIILLVCFLFPSASQLGFSFAALSGVLLLLWKNRTQLHKKLLQKPEKSIRVLSYVALCFLIYSWATTSLYVQFSAKIPFLPRSSLPMKLKCSSCKENAFEVTIYSSALNTTKNEINVIIYINPRNKTDVSLQSSLSTPGNGPIHPGIASKCVPACPIFPNDPKGLPITYPFIPSSGVSYMLDLTIESPPSSGIYTHFDSTAVTFT
jgi:hypothetical protein